MVGMPWDDTRMRQVEETARLCDDACSVDTVSLIGEVRRLRAALLKYGEHTSSDCAPMYGCSCGYLDALGIEYEVPA